MTILLTNAEAVHLTGANRFTLKTKFAELIVAGLVEAHGKGARGFLCSIAESYYEGLVE